MIGNRSDIGGTDLKPEDFSEIFCHDAHAVGLVIYPETGVEDAVIDGIKWPISRSRTEDLSIIEKMKSVIVRKTQSREEQITAMKRINMKSEEFLEVSFIPFYIHQHRRSQITEELCTGIYRT